MIVGRLLARMRVARQTTNSLPRWKAAESMVESRFGLVEDGERPPLVAVINTSEEVAELLSLVLQHDGLQTVVAYALDFKRGRQDLDTFLRNYDPPVVVYDIAIPYADNWAFFERVRASEEGRKRRFVLTTTNKRALDELVGETAAIEIIGKPFDIEEVIAAVRRALREAGIAPADPSSSLGSQPG
jgi:DNA-binding response OmpR family regulator